MVQGLTTADYALFVSLASAAVSLFSLGWNVWSKFIFPKPRLRVSIAFTYAVVDGEIWPEAISATATNYGPSDVTLKALVGLVAAERFYGKSRRAVLRAYQNWPHSSTLCELGATPGLPSRIPVGEHITVFLPMTKSTYHQVVNIGFVDGFGREHFADGGSRRRFRRYAKSSK